MVAMQPTSLTAMSGDRAVKIGQRYGVGRSAATTRLRRTLAQILTARGAPLFLAFTHASSLFIVKNVKLDLSFFPIFKVLIFKETGLSLKMSVYVKYGFTK